MPRVLLNSEVSCESSAGASMRHVLVGNLPLVKDIVREVCRRNSVPAGDEGELLGDVLLKLVANRYAVLRAFRGGTGLRMFLRTVV
jgi:hypothetical protein